MVNLYEIFRINVSRYEEHFWKISLQTNEDVKSYCVGIYIRHKLSILFFGHYFWTRNSIKPKA